MHRRCGFNPSIGNIPAGGNGNPLHYSCLENPMDRGVWWATIHGNTRNSRGLSTWYIYKNISVQFSLDAQSCLLFAAPWTAATVHHQLSELAQTHVHRVGDAIQIYHPLWSRSPTAFNLS